MKQEIMEKSALGSMQEWRDFCESNADVANKSYETFRRHPVMMNGVEGTNLISSFQNIEFFRENKTHIVSQLLSKISLSDCIGSPINTFTFVCNDEKLTLNPTTLRYAKNWANLIDLLLGNSDFESLHISEIGAGYGGDAKVFFDLYSSAALTQKLVEYSVYDLASSVGLIKRFLSEFGYQVSFKNVDDNPIKQNCKHLVISNGALSEMRGELLDAYLKNVVLKADYGYFIVNFDTHSKPYEGGISNEEFFKVLSEAGKNPIWLDEVKFLTRFDKGGSKLIVFGTDQKRVNEAEKRRSSSISNSILARFVQLYSERNLDIRQVARSLKRKIIG
jgi:hypothetical protein